MSHTLVLQQIQMKKSFSLSLLFSYHHAIAMPYARDQVNDVELLCFISFSSFPLFLASLVTIPSHPTFLPSFRMHTEIRMSILMMVWFSFTYLSIGSYFYSCQRIKKAREQLWIVSISFSSSKLSSSNLFSISTTTDKFTAETLVHRHTRIHTSMQYIVNSATTLK